MKLLIIGLGTAGFSAALSARKHSRDVEITIIDEKDFDLLHTCGLPYALNGSTDANALKHSIDSRNMKLNIIRGKAKGIDSKGKKVLVETKKGSREESYDKLIIATGFKVDLPEIEGLKENLGKTAFPFHRYEDLAEIKKRAKKGRKAVVVGAGPIGVELAFSLRSIEMDVALVEAAKHVMPKYFDAEFTKIIEDYLREKDIDLYIGKKVERIGNDFVAADSEKIKSNLTLLVLGVASNTDLAKEAGIEIGEKGISVNNKMETNVRDVYAIGDCVEIPNLITNKRFSPKLAATAYRQGIVAGINAVGGDENYEGSVMTFVSAIGDIEVSSVGLSKELAEHFGYSIVEGKAKATDRPRWMGKPEAISIKLIVDSKTGKILGAQAVGKGAFHRINVVATAIKKEMTVHDLGNVELAYNPEVSDVYDVLLVACDLAKRKLKRD